MRRPLMFVPIALVLLTLAPSALAQHSTAILTVLFTVVDGIVIDCPDEARTPYMACGVSTTPPNDIRLIVNALLSPDIGYVPFTEWKYENGSWQRGYLYSKYGRATLLVTIGDIGGSLSAVIVSSKELATPP